MYMIDAFTVVVDEKKAFVTFKKTGIEYEGKVVASGLSSEQGRNNVILELVVDIPKGPVRPFNAEFPET